MKIDGTYHLTATEKRHIRDIIAKGWQHGATKRKRYELTPTPTGYAGTVYTKERRDNGQPIETRQRFTVAA